MAAIAMFAAFCFFLWRCSRGSRGCGFHDAAATTAATAANERFGPAKKIRQASTNDWGPASTIGSISE